MSYRGTPGAPKRPGLTVPAPSSHAPPPPRWPRLWPLPLPLPLLLLLLVAASGAAGLSPVSGSLGPSVQVTRLLYAGLPKSGDRGDPQTRESEPSAPGYDPGLASGPSVDGVLVPDQGRRALAAPVASSASRVQVSLISTSLVLKGDATHNQAMVHWIGENSSVSDPLVPPALPRHLWILREATIFPYFRTTRGHPCWTFLRTWGTRVTPAALLLVSGYGYFWEGPQICESSLAYAAFPEI
ncbi:VPS10 domain-containing receptor SorCS2 [Lemmus lemmus]